MKKTALVGAVASLCLIGTAGTSALATAHHPAAKHKLKVSLSVSKPSAGQNVKATLTGGKKGVKYVCLLTTYKKGVKLAPKDSFVGSASLDHVANAKGKASCSELFIPGKTPHGHSCPPTKKDKKHGWKCGIAIADQKNAQANPVEGKTYAVGLFK